MGSGKKECETGNTALCVRNTEVMDVEWDVC